MNPKFLKSKILNEKKYFHYNILHRHLGKLQNNWSTNSLVKRLNEDIIGTRAGFWGPYGWKNYLYVDHTASGKALKSVENFIEKEVLPHYANTHTTVSHTSAQTTFFRKEAREIILTSVGGCEDDEVIFCGAGSTAAVHKLVHHVAYPKNKQLVVLVGPFEHHSNILPWREASSKVIQVTMNKSTGHVDIEFLEKILKKLKQSKEKVTIVGCFSAGSNVTGVLSDDVGITEILHEYGALAFWDYAAAAPHVHIDMNPVSTRGLACKDAIYFSGHKFLGGPQTPGVLVVKKRVLQNPVPHGVGGGTVLFTTSKSHRYLTENYDREEGGTPNIIGDIRLGLVFQVRNSFGIDKVMEREAKFCRRVLNAWVKIPEIHILGCTSSQRLPIISFLIQHMESGYYLHHNFVVALLNDMFGIQCRGGCMCAGPYGENLLGVDGNFIVKLFGWDGKRKNDLMERYNAILKPGFVRVSLNFHYSIEEVDFLIEAVKLVAWHGWKFLPFYSISTETGSFIFNEKMLDMKKSAMGQLKSLDSFCLFRYSSLHESDESTNSILPKSNLTFKDCIRESQNFIAALNHGWLLGLAGGFFVSKNPKDISTSSRSTKKFRWFMIQTESALLQRNTSSFSALKLPLPFKPLKFNFTKKPTCKKGSIPDMVAHYWELSNMENSIHLSEYEYEHEHWNGLHFYSNFRFAGNDLPKTFFWKRKWLQPLENS